MDVVGFVRTCARRSIRVRAFAFALLSLLVLPQGMAQAQAASSLPGAAQVPGTQAAFMASLSPRTGDVKLPNGIVTLHLGSAYYYLAPADAERVLVEAWGNPPGNETQGMIFPAGAQPTDADTWGIVLTYVEDGYVDDADAAEIDYAELLQQMQADTADMNAQRKADGFPAMQLVGWAEPPRYDAQRKALHWAKVLRIEGASEDTLNYNVRTLGRRGVLEMNFVAGVAQLPQIKGSIDSVLAVPEYDPGHRYADFDPEVDEVAAYGLGAIVAGKVASKLGLLAGGLLLLKKFWFVIVGVGAWIFSRMRWRASRAAARQRAADSAGPRAQDTAHAQAGDGAASDVPSSPPPPPPSA